MKHYRVITTNPHLLTYEYAATPQEAVEKAQAWLDKYRPELKATALRVLTKKEVDALDLKEALTSLKKYVKPGATIYTSLNHVSTSGMQRAIALYVVDKKSARLVSLTGLAATLLGRKIHKNGGLIINGCGMDMGFALVYELGQAMWPKGTPKPHGTRNGVPDRAGGYALKHSWL